jgi:MSHA pilin protein MshA
MKKNQSLRNGAAQGGFTLVELVIVIAVLGVLAAVALPRFSSLQSEARAAKAQAIAGAVRAAAANVRALSMARGVSCAGTLAANASNVALEGVNMGLAFCYPVAPTTVANTAGTIIDAANIVPANDSVTLALVDLTIHVQINGANSLTNCRVTYTAPTAVDKAPLVSVDTTRC